MTLQCEWKVTMCHQPVQSYQGEIMLNCPIKISLTFKFQQKTGLESFRYFSSLEYLSPVLNFLWCSEWKNIPLFYNCLANVCIYLLVQDKKLSIFLKKVYLKLRNYFINSLWYFVWLWMCSTLSLKHLQYVIIRGQFHGAVYKHEKTA